MVQQTAKKRTAFVFQLGIFFGCGHGELWVVSAYHSGHVFAAGLGLLGDDRQDQDKQNIAFKFKCVVPSPFLKMPLFHNSFHISCNRCIFWTCSMHLPMAILIHQVPSFLHRRRRSKRPRCLGCCCSIHAGTTLCSEYIHVYTVYIMLDMF